VGAAAGVYYRILLFCRAKSFDGDWISRISPIPLGAASWAVARVVPSRLGLPDMLQMV
jgi:hypothetical protein